MYFAEYIKFGKLCHSETCPSIIVFFNKIYIIENLEQS